MVFDPEQHTFDAGGFAVHKDTGHRIGIDQAPAAPSAVGTEYPKYVTPHDSHVVRTGDHVSTPAWPEFHVDREGHVTVLVANADEEDRAVAAAPDEKPAESDHVEPPHDEPEHTEFVAFEPSTAPVEPSSDT